MNRFLSAKPLFAAALAVGTLAAASAAHARSDVHFSIGIGAPIGYAQPAPVYVQPAPVYYERPYHWRQRGHHHHGGWGDRDRDGVPNRYDRAPGNPWRR